MSQPPELYEGPVVGLLRGFSYAANRLDVDVVMPHQETPLPGFGEFLLIEVRLGLALVGRICMHQGAGRLLSEQGDAYLADLSRADERPAPTVVRRLLRYTLKLHLLGHLQVVDGRLQFIVGERELAAFGSPARRPSAAVLAYLASANLEHDPSAAVLGHLVYGRDVHTDVPVKFSVARLKGRRSFVFARAGYGKSNLVKYLISQLYSSPPDVGLLIFDPEGEYALPDSHGRPGLVNVPGLAQRLSLYTSRPVPQEFAACYRGEPVLDLSQFGAGEVIGALLPGEKQEMVFANYLRSTDRDRWQKLVAYLTTQEYQADDREIARLMRYQPNNRSGERDVSLGAVKNNLIPPIRRFHRQGAVLARDLIQELRQARVVIVDTSLLGSEDALAVSSLLLWQVFAYTRKHFTDPTPADVRCVAVLEEAQTVLGGRDLDDRSIFVRWVKEGRKYGLGALMITQQPGAIAESIISQGDNFFVLHLLNEGDLSMLKRHNAYFSDDLLGVIQGEPIPGNCYFWSAPDQPFVLPARVFDFASVCRQAAVATATNAAPAALPAAAPEAEAAARAAEWDRWLKSTIGDVLLADQRVWLYPVAGQTTDRPGRRVVAVSADYLQNAVAHAMRTGRAATPAPDLDRYLATELSADIARCLRARAASSGYAVLAGSKRAVWLLSLRERDLRDGKRFQAGAVTLLTA